VRSLFASAYAASACCAPHWPHAQLSVCCFDIELIWVQQSQAAYPAFGRGQAAKPRTELGYADDLGSVTRLASEAEDASDTLR